MKEDHRGPGSQTRELSDEERERTIDKIFQLEAKLLMQPEHQADYVEADRILQDVVWYRIKQEDIPKLKALFDKHGIE